MRVTVSARLQTLGLFSYRLQIEFVSGILIFVPVKGAPRPQCLRALRPRLAEVAPVQAPLAPHLNHQFFKLSYTELGKL